MKEIKKLDNTSLSVLSIALNGYQQYQAASANVSGLFLQIIELLIGPIADLDIWAIRNLLSSEQERRMRQVTIKVISPTAYDAIASLGERERQVLQLIGQGMRSEVIADLMGISYRTLANHKSNIANKLGLGSARDLVKFAIDNLTAL